MLLSPPDPDLMVLFDFTREDLEANRSGIISDRQIRQMQADRVVSDVDFGCMLAILAVGLMAATTCGIAADVPEIIASVDYFLPAAGIMAVIVGILAAWATWQGSLTRSSRGGHSAGTVEGPLRLSRDIQRSREIHFITVAESRFKISWDVYRGLHTYLQDVGDDARFRLYYTPTTRRVLALEPVDLLPDRE
jgi:hypothetical protein